MPDRILRWGIRRLLKSRLHQLQMQARNSTLDDFLQATKSSPIAVKTASANEQHYEVPAEIFAKVLGDHLKYSCCYWPQGTSDLSQAEQNSLAMTCEHADLRDGQQILELGCGWGSLSLWMAEHFPNNHITALSNSHSQRQYIERQTQQRQLENLTVITSDINDFSPDKKFDRIVSVEMFEHMRNHQALLQKINSWLSLQGKLFVHVFCHKSRPYLFQTEGEQNWMGRYFFTGGMMPSVDLLPKCAQPMELVNSWKWNGMHYAKTCRAWLNNLDKTDSRLDNLLHATYGFSEAAVWRQRWRMFFMACEELFKFHHGNEWYVSHYLFEKCE